MLKRQANPVSLNPSIDPDTNSGKNTQFTHHGNNGLTTKRMDVHKIIRGRGARGKNVQVNADLVHSGRCDVLARSGNDSAQHDEDHMPDGGMWTSVGLSDAPAPSPAKAFIALGLVVGALCLFAGRGGR
jgi:hypothetical protein